MTAERKVRSRAHLAHPHSRPSPRTRPTAAENRLMVLSAAAAHASSAAPSDTSRASILELAGVTVVLAAFFAAALVF